MGLFIAYYFYDNISTSVNTIMNNKREINAFQVGISSNIEDASTISKEYPSSITINDNDNYRVVIALFNNEELTSIYKKYCQDNKINAYVKKISVNNNFYNKLVKYEEFLLNNPDLITSINKSILNSYGELS